jgi:lysozyme
MINNMVYSGTGLAHTAAWEGTKLVAYQDQAGVWTLGNGHTAGVKQGDTCTPEQATAWLQEDTLYAATAVNRLVTVELTQGEFDALVDFVFNLGVGNFTNSTLLKDLNAGNYAAASAQIPRWDLCAGQVNQGLLNRRLGEQEEFNNGNQI